MNPTSRPAIPKTIVTSTARAADGNSGSLKDLATDFPSTGNVGITFNVTAYTVDASMLASGTRFFVDTSPDNGTTWVPVWVSATVTGSTSIRTVLFKNGRLSSVTDIDEFKTAHDATTTTSQIATQFPLSRDKRIRWQLTANNVVTFAAYGFSQPE